MFALICFIIALIASIAGSISGVGGGVIIKPVLDMIGIHSLATISFLSGLTVLSMATVNLILNVTRREKIRIDWRRSGSLAIGSIIGGYLGNWLFQTIKTVVQNDTLVGLIQSTCLFLMVIGVIFFTLYKERLHFRTLFNPLAILAIGSVLGMTSTFLGIGGGPLNIAAIAYFLNMRSKETALNSLFVIFCSQLSGFVVTAVNGMIPPFDPLSLVLMVAGGVLGGAFGRKAGHRLNDRQVDLFFLAILGLLCLINGLNMYQAWLKIA